jgi:hypothetical protein
MRAFGDCPLQSHMLHLQARSVTGPLAARWLVEDFPDCRQRGSMKSSQVFSTGTAKPGFDVL